MKTYGFWSQDKGYIAKQFDSWLNAMLWAKVNGYEFDGEIPAEFA